MHHLEPFNAPGAPCSLPIDQHVLDVAVVLRVHVFRDFILRQPLKILQIKRAGGQVSLTSHDTRFYEESLLAVNLGSGRGVGLGFAMVEDVVSGWMEADHPRVHVDAGGLSKGTFGGLFQPCQRNCQEPDSTSNSPHEWSPPSAPEYWETSSVPASTAQANTMF